eukprot:NODE_6131_length_527_cov_334.675847.p1 GENE.NODE_6131_length_527_cov_334.675847~~NODE_6131_length_527_cov_334.675847.p1  ORF type:complete len:90 (+),score=16.29 NODE_6131_length_527_cov_334.675847:3-272(+)
MGRAGTVTVAFKICVLSCAILLMSYKFLTVRLSMGTTWSELSFCYFIMCQQFREVYLMLFSNFLMYLLKMLVRDFFGRDLAIVGTYYTT